MLDSTDGLPGPVIMNRLGKPVEPMPRYVRGPALQVSLRDSPSRPRMSTCPGVRHRRSAKPPIGAELRERGAGISEMT